MSGRHSPGEAAPLTILVLIEDSPANDFFEGVLQQVTSLGPRVIAASVRPRGELLERMAARGLPTLALGARTARGYPWVALRLAASCRSQQVNVLHAHEPIAAFVAGLAGVLCPRVVVVYHRHHQVETGRQRLLSRCAMLLADAVFGVSEAAAAPARLQRRVPVLVTPNGIPDLRPVAATEVAVLRAELALPSLAVDGPAIVLSLSRMRHDRGLDVLLRAAKVAEDQIDRQVAVVLAGDGPAASELAELGAELGLRVHFVGFVRDTALWLALADVVAAPSRHEGFGLTVVEAMAANRPVIASHVGGLAESVVSGESGLLIPPDDVNALASALSCVLTDSQLSARLAAGGRKRYEQRFTTQHMAQGWLTAYGEVTVRVRQRWRRPKEFA